MSLYADPFTALTLARYHQAVIRDAVPRRERRRRRAPVPSMSRRSMTVVPTGSSAGTTVPRPGSKAA